MTCCQSYPSALSLRLACVCHTLHYTKRLIETIFVHRFSHGTMPLRTIVKVRKSLKLKRRASDNKLLSFTVCGLIFPVLHQFLFFHVLMFIYRYKHVARTTASFQCPSTQGP